MTTMTTSTNEGYEGLVVQNAESGLQELSLLIGGVHCALCIQKIESAIQKLSDVHNARLNFSTGRLNIVWEGAAPRANLFVNTIESLGYSVTPYNADIEDGEAENESRFLLLCLGVAGFAMGNIMLLSIGLWITDTATMGDATRTFLHWISALIAIPTILFSGRPFFRSAWGMLKQGQTNMDVPISLALILATSMSFFETLHHGEHVYFDSAVMLTFFLLIGRYLDFRARRNARSAATDLMKTLSGFANVFENGKVQRVLIRDLREGQDVLVAAGEKIPIDGIVKTGESSIDTSLITGETLPREIKAGQDVYAGTINQSAPLTVTVAKAAENSLLADIVRLMEKAEQGQAKYVRLADKAARIYTPVVHTLAALAFFTWWGIWEADWQEALMVAVTVLIITCPCALGLAVPVVQVLASGLLMRKGILMKSGDALERLANIDTIFFDKTGTLTMGEPKLMGEYDKRVLQTAVSLASKSAHPLSKALTAMYNGECLDVKKFKEHPGQGLEAIIDGRYIKLGNRKWCNADDLDLSTTMMEICLSIDGKVQETFMFEDVLRQDTKTTIEALSSQNLDLVLLSGDRQNIANKVASDVSISSVYAEKTPIEKHEILEGYKRQGHIVMMVGDGLNDAPVLAAADVSMAPGTAVDMAQNAADIVFMGENLSPVSYTYKIAGFAQRLVKQNFGLAVLYNIIAVPLAFLGLVTPMIAALAMSGSSLLVIANSYRLKFKS